LLYCVWSFRFDSLFHQNKTAIGFAQPIFYLTFSAQFYKMSPSKSSEINGSLTENPLAELLAESFASKLSGSFRLSNQQLKIIIYLREGNAVFAVSNSRQHRLFELLLNLRQITKEKLTEFENVANDLEFGQKLVEKGLFRKTDIDVMFAEQLRQVVKTALDWKSGDWSFSPLARIKDDINFKIDLQKTLFDFARNLSPDTVSSRFNGSNDEFILNQSANLNANLQPHEGFILSRLDQKMNREDIKVLCGLPETQILQSLYTLWLGGFISRLNFSSAFSAEQIERMSSAKYKITERVIEKPKVEAVLTQKIEEEVKIIETVEQSVQQEDTIENYLKRAETSFSHYEILGVESTADISEIKKLYFDLARKYHPDKFHNEDEKVRKQLQDAFSKLAEAYDTLKDKDQRELYDFKLKRKITAEEEAQKMREIEKAKGNNQESTVEKIQLAKTYFERGFSLLMANEIEKAIPFLSNATNLSPNTARYHAYYGKSLIGNKKYRHQAEQELLSAIKLEPNSGTFRIMLVEFYIEFNLMKRADGELQKLLEMEPNNKEAKLLLDKIDKK
jgi:curved DNA-binding protein CbpA